MSSKNLEAVPSMPAEPSDPFDPLAFKVSGEIGIVAEGALTAVPVRKPRKDEFFRVHPDEEYVGDFLVVERDSEGETYLISPSCADAVLEVARKVRLFTCMTKRGTTFLWPAKLPTESNAGRRYADTALKIAEEAKVLWVRMWGDRELGGYAYVKARGNLDEPKWRDNTYRDLLRLAFENRIVDDPRHAVIRELNGEL